MARPAKNQEPKDNGQQVEEVADGDVSTEKKSPVKKETKKPDEKYFKVKFHDKSNPEDQDNVELSVNGEVLVLMRNREVILPERFLVCAENATYPVFRQEPGKQRKVRAWVKTFPFTSLGSATKAEFEKQKADGNKKTKENIARFGYNAEVEE